MANDQQHPQGRVVHGSAGAQSDRAEPQSTAVPRESYSLKELCAAHGISRATVYNLMAHGVISTFMLGGRRRISADEFHALPDRLREAAQSEAALARAAQLAEVRSEMGRKGGAGRAAQLAQARSEKLAQAGCIAFAAPVPAAALGRVAGPAPLPPRCGPSSAKVK